MAAIILNGGGASEAADFAAWDVHYEVRSNVGSI